MTQVAQALRASLSAHPGVHRYLVAFSGGKDSTVLLHAAAAYAKERPWLELRAIHVHHGLQAAADEWREHCQQLGRSLGVPVDVYFAHIDVDDPAGPEAAARHARYHLLRACMQPADAVLMAHHADDQLETLLMRLARGAGTRGLAGMPAARRLGPGYLLRPFIELPRECLSAYASEHALDVLVDPSNTDARFDRGFLRTRVVETLKTRWPAAAVSAARSAAHLRQTLDLQAEIAARDLAGLAGGDASLDLAGLARLSPARRINLLRHWIIQRGFRLPSTARLNSVIDDLLAAGADREPLVTWEGAELRRYRDRLYLMAALPSAPGAWQAPWDLGQTLRLPPGSGHLAAVTTRHGGLDPAKMSMAKLKVRFRRGGEQLRPAGGAHTRSLRKLFQERGIKPWMRERVPLVYVGEELAAVADLWLAEPFCTVNDGTGMRLEWYGHPPI